MLSPLSALFGITSPLYKLKNSYSTKLKATKVFSVFWRSSSSVLYPKNRMKKSPIYPGYEAGDYGFDPQVDFLQFLEEARKQTSQENSEGSQQYGEVGKRESDGGKSNRKSWKRSLFSWWKGDKKSNSSMEPLTSSQTSKSRPRGHVSTSGPIYGSGGSGDGGDGGGGGAVCKPRRPTSGPLGGFFHPTKRVENEIAYMCLDKLDDPHQGVQSYGPVYLVS